MVLGRSEYEQLAIHALSFKVLEHRPHGVQLLSFGRFQTGPSKIFFSRAQNLPAFWTLLFEPTLAVLNTDCKQRQTVRKESLWKQR
jgi:hypothetical protein